ncbi:unnamed protein product [Urochloa decumbens]|uniref:Disease resistance R13L4/SHOC-2-like LRR domain-containing protein n=1 Tax=Urochloa decumbens TaxID=240449 RepID=A0ABC8WW02_9POAL
MQPIETHSLCKNHGSRLAMPSFVLALVLLFSLSRSCSDHEKSTLLMFLTGLSQDRGLAAVVEERHGLLHMGGHHLQRKQGGHRGLSVIQRPGRAHLAVPWQPRDSRACCASTCPVNSLSGSLPVVLMFSSSMVSLDVSFNHLGGGLLELPSSVPRRPLQVLNISSNFFTGSFPSTTWEKTTNLIALSASNNSFTGRMPSSFCISAPSLAFLDLSYNQFSGHVPPGLGKCSGLRVFKPGTLEELSVPGLECSGSGKRFPGFINEWLHLEHNNMSGDVPTSLSRCTSLTTISLRRTNFQGELTNINFSTISNLKTLDLYGNNFTGTIPESIYSCSNLTALRLSVNKFHGQLSKRIENLKSLTFLSLTDNNFINITNTLHILKSSRNLKVLLIGLNFRHEVMPQDETMDGFENIQVLGIQNCSLSGKLPVWLSKLTNLKMLLLWNNRLTGPIPSWINSLQSLYNLDISNNSLTGEIPATLMEMPMLKTLDFLALASLDLSFNNLSEGIPQSVCNLINLIVLDLSNNHLTGSIPAALNGLDFLSELNISNNNLEGPIPSGGQFSTFSNSSFDGNPKLCGFILARPCRPAEAHPASILSTRQAVYKASFVIGFSVFFGIGVLYDQIGPVKVFGLVLL